tara:strand:+ start:608 stop:907 length:300 start_codon:yes stop_codon:yes gene_type:complete
MHYRLVPQGATPVDDKAHDTQGLTVFENIVIDPVQYRSECTAINVIFLNQPDAIHQTMGLVINIIRRLGRVLCGPWHRWPVLNRVPFQAIMTQQQGFVK